MSKDKTSMGMVSEGNNNIVLNGDGVIINQESLLLRFLDIISEQNKVISRLQDEVIRLAELRQKELLGGKE